MLFCLHMCGLVALGNQTIIFPSQSQHSETLGMTRKLKLLLPFNTPSCTTIYSARSIHAQWDNGISGQKQAVKKLNRLQLFPLLLQLLLERQGWFLVSAVSAVIQLP